ncbi:UNVERIFIED_CONTAM: hypothetical protein HDU68_010923 [Siphonaria sp. JEL0065]|nr:hypothetical protein HDU68_010923 [Siphonaria sp. JEL0065]
MFKRYIHMPRSGVINVHNTVWSQKNWTLLAVMPQMGNWCTSSYEDPCFSDFKTDPAKTIGSFSEWINQYLVQKLFALVKISYSDEGDQWRHLVTADQLHRLLNDITLEFKTSSRPEFVPPLSTTKTTLPLSLLNVQSFEVNEYEINTFTFYSNNFNADYGNGVLMSLDLSGVGFFRVVGDITLAGHVFSVVKNQQLKSGFNIFMAGHTYEPNAQGTILIPFTNPSMESLMITYNGYTYPVQFNHCNETYQLDAKWVYNREAVRSGNVISVAVCPTVRLTDRNVLVNLRELVPAGNNDGPVKANISIKMVAADGLESTKLLEAAKSELSGEPSLTFSILANESGALGSLRFAYYNTMPSQVIHLEPRNGVLVETPHQTMTVDFPVGSGELTVQVPPTIKLRWNRVVYGEEGCVAGSLWIGNSKPLDSADEWVVASSFTTTESADVRLLASRNFKPVGSVYVKTYPRLSDGREVFSKDGYTDILGRFEYVSLSNTEFLAKVETFAVLVNSESCGDAVFTAKPPKLDSV